MWCITLNTPDLNSWLYSIFVVDVMDRVDFLRVIQYIHTPSVDLVRGQDALAHGQVPSAPSRQNENNRERYVFWGYATVLHLPVVPFKPPRTPKPEDQWTPTPMPTRLPMPSWTPSSRLPHGTTTPRFDPGS